MTRVCEGLDVDRLRKLERSGPAWQQSDCSSPSTLLRQVAAHTVLLLPTSFIHSVFLAHSATLTLPPTPSNQYIISGHYACMHINGEGGGYQRLCAASALVGAGASSRGRASRLHVTASLLVVCRRASAQSGVVQGRRAPLQTGQPSLQGERGSGADSAQGAARRRRNLPVLGQERCWRGAGPHAAAGVQ